MSDIPIHCQVLRTSAFDEALAEHLDLNLTDLRCLEYSIAEPGSTPSRLAELSGLTSGAVTGVVDRLVEAGFVVRHPDPADRRSVTIYPVASGSARLAAALSSFDGAVAASLSEYVPDQRAAIERFLEAARPIVETETARLRVRSRGGFTGDTFRTPLGSVTRGRLVFASGAPRLSLNLSPLGPQASARIIMETSASRLEFAGAAPAGDLLVGTFTGPRPDVRMAAGVATVRYRRKTLTAFTSRRARIALAADIPWTIELEGGLTDLTGSLVGITLERMEIKGGANHIRLALPDPQGTVAVRLTGVASAARFSRPVAVPVAVRVAGGVSHLRIDGRRHEQVGADRFSGDGFEESPNRYTIEVLGGASQVIVDTD